MKRRDFIGAILTTGALACACNQNPKPRYDPKECPFCKGGTPGKCLYCDGSTKCSYCKGTGKRMTQSTPTEDGNIKKVEMPETCPFCKGTGKCHYCGGTGTCKNCKGTAKIDKWEW